MNLLALIFYSIIYETGNDPHTEVVVPEVRLK